MVTTKNSNTNCHDDDTDKNKTSSDINDNKEETNLIPCNDSGDNSK